MWNASWSWARAAAGQQRLGATRSEPLDQPQDTDRHEGRRYSADAAGEPIRILGIESPILRAMTGLACAG